MSLDIAVTVQVRDLCDEAANPQQGCSLVLQCPCTKMYSAVTCQLTTDNRQLSTKDFPSSFRQQHS